MVKSCEIHPLSSQFHCISKQRSVYHPPHPRCFDVRKVEVASFVSCIVQKLRQLCMAAGLCIAWLWGHGDFRGISSNTAGKSPINGGV